MLFSQLALEVGSWSRKNFGDQNGAGAFAPFLGMIEETGEINRAWSLFLAEPGNQESKNSADIIDGHVDRMIYFADFCFRAGILHFFVADRDFSPPVSDFRSSEGLFGELAHAFLKYHQRIRGVTLVDVSEAAGATFDRLVADFYVDTDMLEECIIGYCPPDFANAINETWARVSKRDWVANPVTAAEVIEAIEPFPLPPQ